MKKSEEIEETCKKLKPVIGDKAQELWYTYLAEDEKNRKDLTLDIEIIAEKLLKKDSLEQQIILAVLWDVIAADLTPVLSGTVV